MGDIKVILVGISNSGKSSFMLKYSKNIFSDIYRPTEVSEFGFKIIENNGRLYRLQLWDISDKNKNFGLTKLFVKDAHGCLIFSDSNNIKTGEWIIDLKKTIDKESNFNDKLPCILVEAKRDLLEEDEEKSQEKELKEFAEKNGFDGNFFVSCKTGYLIGEAMDFLLNEILKRIESLIEKGMPILKKEKKEKKDTEKDNKYYKDLIERKFTHKKINYCEDITFSKEEDNIFKIYIDDEDSKEYKYEIDFLKLKEKYEFFECFSDLDEFVDSFDELKEKKRIKINLVLEKKMIQVSVFFYNIYGDEEEITFDLIHEKFNRNLLMDELIKKIVRLKKGKM